MGNLSDASVYADRALKESLEYSIIHEIGNGYNNKGAINTYKGLMDTAVINFEKALSYRLQEDTEDKIPIVIVYINLGVIERSLGDYEKSLGYTYKAIELLISTDKDVVVIHSHFAFCHMHTPHIFILMFLDLLSSIWSHIQQ